MGWMIVSTRRSGRLEPCDIDVEEDNLIDGFACDAEIRAFVICCPGCGAVHDIKATNRHSRTFNRQQQRFRCGRCRFAASVYVVVPTEYSVPVEPVAIADQRL
jgi:hypothetical protein